MAIEARLKTVLWVSAEIKRCEAQFVSAVVLYKGDDERGLVLIKKYVPGNGCKIYSQARDMDDNLIWHCPLTDGFMEENKADQYISRQRDFDEDLWVIEIDDPKDIYHPLSM